MGFAPQPNLWQCGPFALKHALVMLGILADEKQITRIAGSEPSSGTDEVELGRAARKFGCDLRVVRRHDPDEARQELVACLKRGNPCLVCVEEWSHWITVVKEEKGRFILIDSRKKAVLSIVPWRQFKNLWVYHQKNDTDVDFIETIFDFHPVVPRFRVSTRAKFSVARAEYLRQSENRQFAREWDKYFEDLLAICKPRTPLSSNVISLGEFLRRHADMIVDQVAYWHGWIERRKAKRILDNMHFVADTYGLVIHEEGEKRAIAGITSLLSLWAGGRYGVKPVYQAGTKQVKPRPARKARRTRAPSGRRK